MAGGSLAGISAAAPSLDILVPTPENAYQVTIGTSFAAAEVGSLPPQDDHRGHTPRVGQTWCARVPDRALMLGAVVSSANNCRALED